MATGAPFVMSRASPDDMRELVDLEYRCFDLFVQEVFMGPDTPEGRAALCKRYSKNMQGDPSDIWMKVVDASTNRIVAASDWKVHVTCAPSDAMDVLPDWLDGEKLERAKKVVEIMEETRRKSMTGPYIHLHICYTDPDYRRQGAGGMMLQWGTALADQLFLPAWIEASEEGNFLYKAYGFRDFEKIEGELSGTTMKREARSIPIEGGKSKP